jgi:hypothetical protein
MQQKISEQFYEVLGERKIGECWKVHGVNGDDGWVFAVCSCRVGELAACLLGNVAVRRCGLSEKYEGETWQRLAEDFLAFK